MILEVLQGLLQPGQLGVELHALLLQDPGLLPQALQLGYDLWRYCRDVWWSGVALRQLLLRVKERGGVCVNMEAVICEDAEQSSLLQ